MAVLLNPLLKVPLQAGGTERARFPSRSGGNLKEGGRDDNLMARGGISRMLTPTVATIGAALNAPMAYQRAKSLSVGG
jgi:hypothetical protein